MHQVCHNFIKYWQDFQNWSIDDFKIGQYLKMLLQIIGTLYTLDPLIQGPARTAGGPAHAGG